MSQQRGFEWKPFITWLLANIFGFGILGAVILLLPYLNIPLGFLSSVLIIAIPISIAQWFALRRFIPVTFLWILAAPLGLLLAIFMIKYIPVSTWDYLDSEAPGVLITLYLAMSFVFSLPQWLIFRRYYQKASHWIVGTTLGFTLGMGVVIVTDMINRSGILAFILVSLVYIIITGLTFSWLITNANQRSITLSGNTQIEPEIQVSRYE
jgi:hypothetical protein